MCLPQIRQRTHLCLYRTNAIFSIDAGAAGLLRGGCIMVFWHCGMHQVDLANRSMALDGRQHAQHLEPDAYQGFACVLRVWLVFCSRAPDVECIATPNLPLPVHHHAKKLVVMRHSLNRASCSFKTRALRLAQPPRRAHPRLQKNEKPVRSCHAIFSRLPQLALLRMRATCSAPRWLRLRCWKGLVWV